MENFLAVMLLSLYYLGAVSGQDPDPCDTFTCSANEICVIDVDMQPFCICPTSDTSPPCASASDSRCKAPEDTGVCTEEAYDAECSLINPCRGDKICCLSFCGTDCVDPPSGGGGFSNSGFLKLLIISMILSGRQRCPRDLPASCYNECQLTKCSTHYNAGCEATCDGCVANYFDKWGHDITSQCSCNYRQVSCPNLCRGKTCRGYPDSECRISNCGECSYAFFDHYGHRLQCRQPIKLPAPITILSQSSYDQRCQRLAPTYNTNTCPPRVCNSNADCRSDYMCCGFVRCGSVCVRKPTPCDVGQNLVLCPDLCQSITCIGRPRARCRVNNCNACIPEFFDNSNRLLKKCFRPA